MKYDILDSLRRVPQLDGKYRYIPIFTVPAGTIIQFETTDILTPGEREDRILNTKKEEYDVLTAPAGRYELRTTEMPTMSLRGPDGSTEDVSPLHRVMAAGSLFTANLDRNHEYPDMYNEEWATTWRLRTGVITSITLPQVGIRLHCDDFLRHPEAILRRAEVI